jgi:hypothetical protein
MKTLRLIFLALFSSVLALAVDIPTYTVHLQAAPDGSGQAVATIALAGCTPGSFNLPLGFTAVQDLRVDEPAAGIRVEPTEHNGITQLKVTLPSDIPAKVTMRLSFRLKQVFQIVKLKEGEKSPLPASSRTFKHAFVNTQEYLIGAYRVEFLFPDGLMAQAIREQLPKPAKNEVGPRVLLSKLDGHQAAILQFNKLQQGDDTSMIVELVPTRRSLGWLLAGLLLGGVYLFKFKDLVANKQP